MTNTWEQEIASFLKDLLKVQGRLLQYLRRKRDCLARADIRGLEELTAEGAELEGELQTCLDRRAELLARAQAEGYAVDSIRSLSVAVAARSEVSRQLAEASHVARLLQIHNLTNWMLNQRALIHLSQLIEIIATGGHGLPTYEKGAAAHQACASGSLLDRSI